MAKMPKSDTTMDVGVKAPLYGYGMKDLIKEASGKTVGIIRDRRGEIVTGTETFKDGLPKGSK